MNFKSTGVWLEACFDALPTRCGCRGDLKRSIQERKLVDMNIGRENIRIVDGQNRNDVVVFIHQW
jgi:hypothetical protein